ncbi:MAG: glycosyltransferase family 8 protein [Roseburia sp.]|nr:glycosyltransferase family 8 protein [Roseburia sp.]
MNIVYASNNDYAKYLGISMLSLFHNNQNINEIIVYILSQNINSENRRKLCAIAKHYQRTIEFIDISEFGKLIPFTFNTSGFHPIVLSRLFLCRYIPEERKRVLYLDCDIIVNGSIEELESLPFGQNYVAAVPELYMPVDKKKRIGLNASETYYNAGVLLINLELWRSMDLETVFMDYYQAMNGQLDYNDQDIINHCCKNKISALDYTYNLSTNLPYFPRYFVKKLQPAYDIPSKDVYAQILRKPAIIHYMGDERPWIEGNHNKYRKQYGYYAKRSPWKEEPLVQGQQLYMFCYHLLNVITLICPWFRVFFSRLIGINKFKWTHKK